MSLIDLFLLNWYLKVFQELIPRRPSGCKCDYQAADLGFPRSDKILPNGRF